MSEIPDGKVNHVDTSTSSSKPKPRGKRPADTPDTKLSKALSYVLRHGAEKEGLHMDSGGFISVWELMNTSRIKSQKFTFEDVQRIVETNDKNRFTLLYDLTKVTDENSPSVNSSTKNPKSLPPTHGWFIRANQGHSLKTATNLLLEPLLTVADFPADVIHGTYFKQWDLIKSSDGLSKMNRVHIHLAPGKLGEDGVTSGMRKTCTVFIYVDIARALAQGVQFYKSSNNVILTEGDQNGFLQKELFLKVEDSKGNSLEF
ncbi:tRNA 2'-phosphotransferase 1 [Nadsonia fulvescens var. elongata DSM 6958]|uniref:2'-phosphotransferase n=1 Tax=Nadsonia fulvescens var. elongata DSM 6958 TaxID=857566 RepID=A0A1E3PU66_9ASCO|nr:tRNA 2'-phosphotransferase 1 [Nadsonia fulvescens var. elongata DSM 6958]